MKMFRVYEKQRMRAKQLGLKYSDIKNATKNHLPALSLYFNYCTRKAEYESKIEKCLIEAEAKK